MNKALFWSALSIALLVGFGAGLVTQTIRDPIGWFLLGLAFSSIVVLGVGQLTIWMLDRFDNDPKRD